MNNWLRSKKGKPMCDTIYVPANLTKKGIALIAKNSDRDPNEAHLLEMHPRIKHLSGDVVKCTYMSIPQVSETNAVLLAKPFWMWGAEMGSNDSGVTIGNEAVFTRVPYEKGAGLTGMDLLRLALERGSTAYDAMKVIIDLLEKYGQGGNCGFLHKFYYHNSFLIADPSDAWVLETAGKYWAAEHVKGVRTISNAITITNKWELAATDLVEHAIEKRWCKKPEDFNFSKCYSDPLMTYFGDAKGRQTCTTMNLTHGNKEIEARDLMELLRTFVGGTYPIGHLIADLPERIFACMRVLGQCGSMKQQDPWSLSLVRRTSFIGSQEQQLHVQVYSNRSGLMADCLILDLHHPENTTRIRSGGVMNSCTVK